MKKSRLHHLRPEQGVHGFFSRELAPALAIDPGDTVVFHTLDSGWGAIEQPANFTEPNDFTPRDLNRDVAHALTGPVEISGTRPGMVLEIRLKRIQPGRWGWSAGPEMPAQLDARLGIAGGATGPPALIKAPRGTEATFWELHSADGIGVSRSGYRLRLRPFMGVMGMPLDQPGVQSTFPPTACGGNLDCKDLTAGSAVFLPIAVAGALFSTGDGHAVQGDGEVAGPALNCPMEVEMEFHLRSDLSLRLPRARTAEGWLTFGFHRDLNEAAAIASLEMVALMRELYGLSAKDALSMASLVVHLRITQIVNGVRGVHAVLPHGALEPLGRA
ncbi:MAG: acetamidase/formamidase family protein [Candidatus Binataceae bacterium]